MSNLTEHLEGKLSDLEGCSRGYTAQMLAEECKKIALAYEEWKQSNKKEKLNNLRSQQHSIPVQQLKADYAKFMNMTDNQLFDEFIKTYPNGK